MIHAILAMHLTMNVSCLFPTDAEKAMCYPDVRKMCEAETKLGIFPVLFCLKANRQKLSKPCRGLLEMCGQ